MEAVISELKLVWRNKLKCCICYEYIIPPVTEICVSGHNGCETCVTHLTECPLCHLPADKYRNEGVEESCRSNKIKIPCNNQFWGCPEETLIDGMKNHAAVCVYQQELCPFVSPRGTCSWKGPIKYLKQHILACHKECRVIVLDEEMINFTDKCVTQTLVLIRGHEIFLVITDFNLPAPFKYYCIRAQYFGPKHDFPSYKFEGSLGGVCRHDAEFEGCTNTKDEKESKDGLHVHIPTRCFDDVCKYRVPIYKRKFSIKISKKSSVTSDFCRARNGLN